MIMVGKIVLVLVLVMVVTMIVLVVMLSNSFWMSSIGLKEICRSRMVKLVAITLGMMLVTMK